MSQQENNVIIIGAGISGIAMACQLQRQLNFTDFEIYDRDDNFGGTWYENTYPGCGCDVPSFFYSFSFAQKRDWTQVFPLQPEIQQYIVDVAKTYDLPAHTHFRTECLGAEWNQLTERWMVYFKKLETGENFRKSCRFLVAAAGILSVPNPCPVPGAENFKGGIWHSSRWNHQVSIENKDVIVIGNGCSASQFVPVIVPKVKTLTQFIRSPHWVLYRPNFKYSERFKWIMRNIPGANTLHRFFWATFLDIWFIMFKTKSGKWIRNLTAKGAEKYMRQQTPAKYHDILIPKFEMGAKRRIFDATYLQSLNDPKVELTNDPLIEIKEKSVLTKSGKEYPADVIVYANGFYIFEPMIPMRIMGKSGEDIHSRWKRQGGSRAYMGIMIADFPNFFTIVGPNTASGHYSVLFMAECNVNFVIKLMKPSLRAGKGYIEVTEKAEKEDVEWVQSRLKKCIWRVDRESGWYLNKKTGHNNAIYPNFQINYWLRSLRPQWSDFVLSEVKKPKQFGLEMLVVFFTVVIILITLWVTTKLL